MEIKVEEKIEVSTNLWIPPHHYICSHIKNSGKHHL